LAKTKPRARDLKKQRWAGIVAAVLALGMLVSLVGVYIGQAFRGERTAPSAQETELQPEDYLAYYQDQIDNLELYLEDNEPTEAVLLELAENYRYLDYIRQMFFDDAEALEEVQAKLAEIYLTLVEMEPENPQYRLELISFYRETGEEGPATEQIATLLELLHQNPDPLYHLSLLGLLNAAGESDPALKDLAALEIEWLRLYFEEKQEAGPLESQEQFYHAVLLGEYLDETEAAEAILASILETEDEESKVYQDALSYQGYLRPEVIEDEQTVEKSAEEPAD
jgi:hypothetical protein